MPRVKKSEPKKEIKPDNLKEEIKNCPCQPLPNWVKYLVVVLVIATFVMVCFCLHYLWKLSDIWQAIKNTK